MKKATLYLWACAFFSLLTLPATAQLDGHEQVGEVGIAVGGAHYFGDLNNHSNLKSPKLSLGVYIRKNINNYVSLRLMANYAQLGYSDRYSSNIVEKQRNLSFNTDIWEGAVMMDFNFFKFIPISSENAFTPYLTFGLGFFNYDPYTYLGGKKYALRKLGTEGQNLPDSLRRGKKYGPVAICFPLGMGIKYAINSKWNIGFEVVYRFTTTDYIDDVSTQYAGNANSPATLPNGLPNPAYLLQDRSYEYRPAGQRFGDIPGRQRGFSQQKDHYLFAQFTLSLNFSKYNCPNY